jgi:tungstate transport system substrate-binding protein
MPRLSPRKTTGAVFVLAVLVLAGCGPSPENGAQPPERQSIILATTTSTQDSGLLDVLLPLFEEQTGYRVKTIAVGTGEALAMGKRGDADVLLAHAPAKEKEVVAEGAAINRRLVMHNDFLIAGPEADPAGTHGSDSGAESVARIAEAEARFVSRGDNSGTHIREMTLWEAAAIEPAGDWYIETGQGMGATLLIASEKGGYVLTDRGTYLAFQERIDLVPHVEGDPLFLNIYSVLEVNPQRFPKVNSAGAKAFSEFIRGSEAQEIIRGFGVEEYGQPLFFPDAGESLEEPGSEERPAD